MKDTRFLEHGRLLVKAKKEAAKKILRDVRAAFAWMEEATFGACVQCGARQDRPYPAPAYRSVLGSGRKSPTAYARLPP